VIDTIIPKLPSNNEIATCIVAGLTNKEARAKFCIHETNAANKTAEAKINKFYKVALKIEEWKERNPNKPARMQYLKTCMKTRTNLHPKEAEGIITAIMEAQDAKI
jgi:pyrroloquinoline quinone (PQQ) biosynthesis protein C